jgi:hypothetical protein
VAAVDVSGGVLVEVFVVGEAWPGVMGVEIEEKGALGSNEVVGGGWTAAGDIISCSSEVEGLGLSAHPAIPTDCDI